MTLNLTSAVKVREPGFSRSECLELAREIERDNIWPDGIFECEQCGFDGEMPNEGQRRLIVAALRAYAE